MTPSIDELQKIYDAATACRASGQSLSDWTDDRQRARFEIVDHLPALLSRLASLEAENAALRGGLEPFADAGERWLGPRHEVILKYGDKELRVSDLRNAALTLRSKDDG